MTVGWERAVIREGRVFVSQGTTLFFSEPLVPAREPRFSEHGWVDVDGQIDQLDARADGLYIGLVGGRQLRLTGHGPEDFALRVVEVAQ